jgi:hypothetical protein
MRGNSTSKAPLTLPSPSRGEGLLTSFAKCIVRYQNKTWMKGEIQLPCFALFNLVFSAPPRFNCRF